MLALAPGRAGCHRPCRDPGRSASRPASAGCHRHPRHKDQQSQWAGKTGPAERPKKATAFCEATISGFQGHVTMSLVTTERTSFTVAPHVRCLGCDHFIPFLSKTAATRRQVHCAFFLGVAKPMASCLCTPAAARFDDPSSGRVRTF